MVKENQNIDVLHQEDLKGHMTFHLINCIINTIDLVGVFELNGYLMIENCIINNLKIHSCWFVNGLLIKNSIIKKPVDYQMGGHNAKPIVIEGNIFNGFFNFFEDGKHIKGLAINFFDCQFGNRIELNNNVFIKGTNLLGNKGEGFENSFIEGWLAENNVGSIDLNKVEM